MAKKAVKKATKKVAKKAAKKAVKKDPIKNISDIDERVRGVLPKHALEIFKEAFNHAWWQYQKKEKRLLGSTRVETAHRVAWAAVKKEYEKNEKGKWVKK